MVTIAGWHRDHARKMLRQAAAGELPGPHTPRERMLRYGPEVTDAVSAAPAIRLHQAKKVMPRSA